MRPKFLTLTQNGIKPKGLNTYTRETGLIASGVHEHVDLNSKIASTNSELQVTGTFDSVPSWQDAKEGVEAAVWVLLTASFVTTMKRLFMKPGEQNELSAKVHRL